LVVGTEGVRAAVYPHVEECGSAKEVEYQVSIAQRLGYAEPQLLDELANQASETAKVLNGLVRGLRNKT
jgi:hypothetical protein